MSDDAIWVRPEPARVLPRRGAGGFYRTADVPGKARGVPLSKPDDALVAAVRLAYRVAEAQVDRSARLAERLRDAGDRVAGADSSRKAMDATERLVMKTMMSALQWWETSVAQGRCPVKRLAAAEYRMMGQLLGFDTPKAATADNTGDDGSLPRAAPIARARRKLQVRLEGRRHPVRVVDWELDGGADIDGDLEFFHESGGSLAAQLTVSRAGAILTMHFPADRSARIAQGAWVAAICTPRGEQVGFIGITL